MLISLTKLTASSSYKLCDDFYLPKVLAKAYVGALSLIALLNMCVTNMVYEALRHFET